MIKLLNHETLHGSGGGSELTALCLLKVPQVFHGELQDVGLLQLTLSNLIG